MPGQAERAGSPKESGQAMVEAAITLPLTVFLILGTLQLFMMLHGRIMVEYAVYRATRAGSVNMADCRVMTHTALAALLPALGARTDSPGALADAFALRKDNEFSAQDRSSAGTPRQGAIVWLLPRLDRDVSDRHQETFDDTTLPNEPRAELQLDLVFWYPLRIPFADWVMARMFLAYFGGMPYVAANPLLPTVKNADWKKEGGTLTDAMRAELGKRVGSKDYVAPIRSSFRMRMMTPALQRDQPCPNSPEKL